MSTHERVLAVTVAAAALAAPARAGDPPLLPLPSYDAPGQSALARLVTGDVDGDGLVDLLAPANGVLTLSRGRPDGSFAPVESFVAPQARDLLALGDVDGDGDLDAITDHGQFAFESAGLAVLLNDGDGAFAAGTWTYSGTVGTLDPLCVDVDGDGFDDIVVAETVTSQTSVVHVFRSTGDGSFEPPVDHRIAGYVTRAAAGDLDLDGDVDLVLSTTPSILQLRNDGDGSFTEGPDAPVSAASWLAFQLVDVTEDGRLDATRMHEFAPVLSVLPGQADGSFGAEIQVALPFVGERARFAHLDDDAIVDLAVSGPGGIAVLRGLGGLAYDEVQRLPRPIQWIDAIDVDIDGHADLVALDGDVVVALALEDGGFDSSLELVVDEGLHDVALADLDGDGRLDLIEAHVSPNVVQVKLQQADASFLLVQTLPTLASPVLHPCQLDADGLPDLVVSSSSGASAAFALSQGDGTLSAFSASIQAGRDLLVADMNADGHDDLVGWVPTSSWELRVTHGTGLGTFSGTAVWSSPVPLHQLVAADIDQDGWIDILTGDGTISSPILKWVNTGGNLALKGFNPPLVASAVDLLVADVNGDGDPDLIALPDHLCMGAPSGQFLPPVTVAGFANAVLGTADLDGDGFDDVVAAPRENGLLRVLRGGPSGPSTSHEGYGGATPDKIRVVVGDVDGNGRLDVLTGAHEDDGPDTGEDFVSIWLQRSPGPFDDLGFALAGSAGAPALTGIGTLVGGTPLSLRVTGAKPLAAARLVVGAQLLLAPFKGGVLVPVPALVLPPFPTDAVGKLVLDATWPPAFPSGLSLYLQAWITDAAGPAGLAATNGLQLTAP